MSWFVSRERFDEQRAELNRLRTELAAERDKNQRLWNFMNWRTAGGVAFDTTQLPEAYQPRTGPQPATSASGEETAKAIRGVRAPGQARRELAEFETRQQQDFERATVGSRPAHVSKEQIALVREMSQAADEGQKMAGD